MSRGDPVFVGQVLVFKKRQFRVRGIATGPGRARVAARMIRGSSVTNYRGRWIVVTEVECATSENQCSPAVGNTTEHQ